MKKTIHPFPARMASGIAMKALSRLPKGAKVLDPMAGSGTVLRAAQAQGHDVRGYDLDPLAVLISKVWTTPFRKSLFEEIFNRLVQDISSTRRKTFPLPWIDKDQETSEFVNYWFGKPQQRDLRKIAFYLHQYEQEGVNQNVINALKVALSRIIITKKVGASLAWDVSHSRPHKVMSRNKFKVVEGFRLSAERLFKQLEFETDSLGKAIVYRGDARKLTRIQDKSVDAIITSPPYLNAIDYLRGHKLALIWFGYTIPEIRKIRSTSVGAERGLAANTNEQVQKIRSKLPKVEELPTAKIKMIDRYIADAIGLMAEVSRVLVKKGQAVFVIGNSCLKGVYISNSEIFRHAGELHGLKLLRSHRRPLPTNSRYLPMPKGKKAALGKRMRYEVVQTFKK